MTQLIGPACPQERGGQALEAVRIAVALLILIHGSFRMFTGGVVPFGMWLETQGFPSGYWFALAVTLAELICPILILLRRFVSLCAAVHIFILTLGMVMVHLPSGWFVVGAGRNGMEYSALLILCLSAVAWAYAPLSRSSADRGSQG